MAQTTDKSLPHRAIAAVAASGPPRASVSLDNAMDRYARGDQGALSEIFRQGVPRLRGFLLRLCGDAAFADDLTQETMLRIHLARGTFVAGSAALPWMFAIARNSFLDHARREGVRRKVIHRAAAPEDGAGALAPAETRGDEVLVARESLEIVRRTLESLPLTQREAFVLIRFEGLSVSQAAQVLGASEAAVKVRAFRAYEALRAALHSEGEPPSPRNDAR